MCGRYVAPKAADIEREWNIIHAPNPFDRIDWNTAPTHVVPVVREGEAGAPSIAGLRWGLIPAWAKGVAPKYGTINATVERLREAPTWRGAWRAGRRCIVPALGFYEWQQVEGPGGKPAKRPYYIRIGDQAIFGMAGLWDRSVAGDGAVIESFTIVTVPANRVMEVIHNGRARMPAILPREAHEAWLAGDEDGAYALLAPYEDELMITHPVSSRVNSPRNNDPGLIEDTGPDA
jgi:putative SOS response-associated peptidase YedK